MTLKKKYVDLIILITTIIIITMFLNKIPEQSVFSGEGIITKLDAGESRLFQITMENNERVTSAKITVAPSNEVAYKLEVADGSFYDTMNKTFDVTSSINNFMEFCAVQTCNIPITITSAVEANITINAIIDATAISIEPAVKSVERTQVPIKSIQNTLLVIVVIIVIIAIIFPKVPIKIISKL